MRFAVLWLCLASSTAFAQPTATAFPEGATPVSEEMLKAAVSDKVFKVTPASGPTWRWQFNANGRWFINVGSFSDSGTWRVKESSLCTEGRKINGSCNEVRALGTDHYLKRDSGEVVKLVVQ